ncbi:hypothetical protein CD198_06150 [Leuconostoc mesenteroides]|uniref:hypothetical protein n=1 Tax=Leuconostoc mesenteroides TaxID=1245 RepID=UPI000DAAEB6B|nr:hypothetical protein [Leuconostoc mesenteroides]AWV38073.1 hypothetical protein CD198_06150 [Leuconostoc mesenteroides]
MLQLQEGTHSGQTDSGKKIEYSLFFVGGIGEPGEYQLDFKVEGETQSYSMIIKRGQTAELSGVKIIF